MTKALNATLEDGKVKVGNLVIEGAEIFSQGSADSEGILFIDNGKYYYFPTTTSDLVTFIEKVISGLDNTGMALTQISTTLTSIGAGMTGPTTASPPTLGTDVAQIVSKVSELTSIQSDLEALKGDLK